jgi:hypothetical protein
MSVTFSFGLRLALVVGEFRQQETDIHTECSTELLHATFFVAILHPDLERRCIVRYNLGFVSHNVHICAPLIPSAMTA